MCLNNKTYCCAQSSQYGIYRIDCTEQMKDLIDAIISTPDDDGL